MYTIIYTYPASFHTHIDHVIYIYIHIWKYLPTNLWKLSGTHPYLLRCFLCFRHHGTNLAAMQVTSRVEPREKLQKTAFLSGKKKRKGCVRVQFRKSEFGKNDGKKMLGFFIGWQWWNLCVSWNDVNFSWCFSMSHKHCGCFGFVWICLKPKFKLRKGMSRDVFQFA